MKFAVALLALPVMASAFAPSPAFSRSSALSMAPAGGKPAASHEDDLDKTFKVIMDFNSDGEEAPEEPKEEKQTKKKKKKAKQED
mmetsp:Transcript_14614/g.29537  ORF Transcript_14614/g.29537 Transcript_14614/m.29537 type:complete len:85 (-) Transcript_14614:367-621(-)